MSYINPFTIAPIFSKVTNYPIPNAVASFVVNRQNIGIDSSFIIPLDIHKEYGVEEIPGIEVINIEQSNNKDKKYAITVRYQGVTKTIHYGNSNYEQYQDRTPVKAFSHADHYDEQRRRSYLARSSKITNSTGLAANDPFSANRYSIITLW